MAEALPEVGPLAKKLKQTHAASRHRMLVSFLQEELRSLTGQAELPEIDQPIIDENVDSLMIVEFRDRLQAQMGSSIELPATIVFDHPRLTDLATHLLGAMEEPPPKQPPGSSRNGAAMLKDRTATPRPRIPAATEGSSQAEGEPIENMSEQQAMEALLREVNEG